MDKKSTVYFPSIFNDVIGPVMRGPSSSHCAASVRIGRMARDLMNTDIRDVLIKFDTNGSLATTHESQGSDMGLFAGFLGWEIFDERLPEAAQTLSNAGINITIKISDLGADHPNTYKLNLKNTAEHHELIALSTGSGMIEVIAIDGVSLSMAGDYHETLIFVEGAEDKVFAYVMKNVEAEDILLRKGKDTTFIQIKTRDVLSDAIIADLRAHENIRWIKRFSPVLPVLSSKNMHVPFITCREMLTYNERRNLPLWELALDYESIRGGLSHQDIFQKMGEIVTIMQNAVRRGIDGTEYADRILGYQSGAFLKQMENRQLLDTGILNRIILNVTAMMESKSSMGVIVAAPTAGACGVLPGAVIGAAESMRLDNDQITRALLASGMIGVFIAANATFAAEIGGCQAECGAGSGMAAAGLVTLAGGSTTQALDAASMALQNSLGMICDPVANRVEVPCLGRNVMAAANALACTNMAMAGYDPVVPLDEVIETMDSVGKSIPCELRCTALGGLSVTKTSVDIQKRLERHKKKPTA